ncbi:HlyD family secretion protein [Ralstonia soli]|uniref:Biotin/lipoyl-binding protein n=1 Tax=Ralstonia soli TaxID=2953896 RepID=A0ABT1AS31_9RALS|nr:biotin/lipoyl-binding protein [Ralstonia soli]MCO5401241.1 biotin/lipoyl-binding protein [Ralstonia soli]
MKIRFDSSKERSPTQEQGLKVLYAPGKRMAFRLRWYLILLLVASPLIWFFAKLAVGAWMIEAPAQLVLPQIDIRSREPALVSRVNVRAGDKVEAGQVLLDMDNPEWKQRLRQLQALSNDAQAAPVPAASTLRDVLRRQLDRSSEKLALTRRLVREGAATQGEVLAAEAERDQRQAELLSYEQRQEQARTSPALARDVAMQGAEEQWLTGRLQALQLKAPEPGVVSEVLVHEGENVGAGTLLVRVARMADAVIWVYLDPAHAAYGKPGQPLRLKLPDGHWLDAKVLQSADRANRLPEDLRSPFGAPQRWLMVQVAVDGAIPQRWLIDQLPLTARFPHRLSSLFSSD